MNLIRKEFEFVQKTFFPKLKFWKIRVNKNIPSLGRCKKERKLIEIRRILKGPTERQKLLIHELCHSSINGHGKTFLTRMTLVAQKAEVMGNTILADAIKTEIGEYKEANKEGYRDVLGQTMSDWTWERPDLSFKILVM